MSYTEQQKALEGYYNHYVNKTSSIPLPCQSKTNMGYAASTIIKKNTQPGPSSTLTWKNMQDMYIAAGTNTTGPFENLDSWDKKAKESMAKIGFKYNGEKDVYELELTATVEIKEPLGLMAVVSDNSSGNMRDEAIAAIKRVKNNLIKNQLEKLVK